MGRNSAHKGNALDRAWRNRWRSLTLVGCGLAFWMGLRSPVSEGVVEPTSPIHARNEPDHRAPHSTRLATRFTSVVEGSNPLAR